MKNIKLYVIFSIVFVCSVYTNSLSIEIQNNDELKEATTTAVAVQTASLPTIAPPKPGTTVCYDYVGCFDNKPPFDNAANYVPVPPEIINTGIWLYRDSEQEDPEVLSYFDENAIKKSNYDKRYPLKLVVHGFQNNGTTPWVPKMAKNLLIREKNKANVIVIDWGQGAPFPLYYNATANTRLVGRQICLTIKLIKKIFYDDVWSKDLNIHCIGHSLGAHTCGYASKHCDRKFNRITAMDPAGPNFEGSDATVRVDKTDATFVDVIHSNGDNLLTGNFGMSTAVGHVDFYPNGGKQQPGCPSIVDSILGLFSNASAAASGVSCSHARAIDYFSDSINSPCTYLGYPCKDQASFEKGDCLTCGTEGCAQMGYFTSTKARGVKYLMTEIRDPFCAYTYLIEITINPVAPKTAGEISVILKSGSENVTGSFTKKTDEIVSAEVYKRVFASRRDIFEIDTVMVRFDKKAKPLFSADPYAPQLVIDKVRLLVAETDEVHSECVPNLSIRDKESVQIKLNMEDCLLRAKESNRKMLLQKLMKL